MTTYSTILVILQKINSWKQFSAMHEECPLLLSLLLLLLFLSWNYIVFCIKTALGVENKKNYYMQLSALETAQSREMNKKPQCIATNDTT